MSNVRRWPNPAPLGLAALLCPAGPALAQSPAPAPAPTPSSKPLAGVTVQAAPQQAVRASIDRRSYSVATDLQGQTGSIGDALRNVPAVEVDIQGNVSLRGSRNVVILVDGAPTGQFSGPGGGQQLQSLPADQIDRVEVITNPTAAFSPEGSAGIINLVTKKTRKPGAYGSMRAMLGDSGRRNGSGNVSYNAGKLTLSADAAASQNPQHFTQDNLSIATGPAGVQTRRERDAQNGDFDAWNAHIGIDYALDPKTQISGQARSSGFTFNSDNSVDATTTADGAAPLPFAQAAHVPVQRDVTTGQATLRHQFKGDGHELVVNLTEEKVRYHLDDGLTDTPALTPPFQDQQARNHLSQLDLKADYTRPMDKDAKLKAGFDVRITDNSYGNQTLDGTGFGDAMADPARAALFHYQQTVEAAYVTYEQPFGKWTVLAGLRVEDERLNLDEEIQKTAVSRDEVRPFPSLHLAYQATPEGQWIVSYSSRIQRPGPFDLNPYVNRNDPFNLRTGNPLLEPQVTQSFEGGYQYKKGAASYLATLFYRQNEKGVTDVTTDLGGGVLLDSRANLGQSQNAGLELVASAPLTKTLTYNVSTDLYWNRLQAPVFGIQTQRSGFSASGRASLNWQATKADLFQVNGQLSARSLTPQGYSDPAFFLFLGYRRKFNDAWSGLVTVTDPFDSYRSRSVVDTPGLQQVDSGRGNGRAISLGFTYTFGGKGKARDPGFDFAPAGGGGGPGG